MICQPPLHNLLPWQLHEYKLSDAAELNVAKPLLVKQLVFYRSTQELLLLLVYRKPTTAGPDGTLQLHHCPGVLCFYRARVATEGVNIDTQLCRRMLIRTANLRETNYDVVVMSIIV